jgi:CRISPR/Cas system Type II protein with McrA/HNH and RuvC-like nuclease domain
VEETQVSEKRCDLAPEEYEHPLGYLFRRGPKRAHTRKLIRTFLRQNGLCHYCGDEMSPYVSSDDSEPEHMTIDHIVPLARGGSNRHENLVACCVGCNNLKDNMLADEFAFFMEILSPLPSLFQRLIEEAHRADTAVQLVRRSA